MRYLRLILCLISVAYTSSANAQIRESISTRIGTTTTDTTTTIASLSTRIQALESTIAQLQQKLAFIKSVSPLVLDPGADVTIRGGRIALEAQTNLDVKAGSNSTIQAWGNLIVESKVALDLKGMPVRHNAGTMSVVCAPVGGATFGTPGPCSANVLVPPPFQ